MVKKKAENGTTSHKSDGYPEVFPRRFLVQYYAHTVSVHEMCGFQANQMYAFTLYSS